jgi:hypothetical protein
VRRLIFDDLLSLARALHPLPEAERESAGRLILEQAHAADRFRASCGRNHPLWGNGTLDAAARRHGLSAASNLSEDAFLRCLHASLGEVIKWKATKTGSSVV